jgi:hypothetical protein
VPSLVSYPLYVLKRDRAAARRIIGDRGGLGSMSFDRGAVIGAVSVVCLTMLGVIVVLLRA